MEEVKWKKRRAWKKKRSERRGAANVIVRKERLREEEVKM